MTTSAYAEANGIRLHYLAEGAGPLMVFLHGFPEYSGAWKDQLAEFGKDHLAVAPDMRGYNLSDKPAELEQYRMAHLCEDVRGLAEKLGYSRFTLVGHDWGGVVAWSLAIAQPECLERLIIINAPHPAIFRRLLAEDAAQQQASRYMQLLRSPEAEATLSANHFAWLTGALFGGGRPAPREHALARPARGRSRGIVIRTPMHEAGSLALGGKLFGSEEDKRGYIEAWSQPGALTGGLNYYRAMRAGSPDARPAPDSAQRAFTPEATPSPGQRPVPGHSPQQRGTENTEFSASATLVVHVPTLVIWGEQDTALLTGNLVGLEQFVPALSVRRIPDGSHWVIHEQPALVNRHIREFLAAGYGVRAK